MKKRGLMPGFTFSNELISRNQSMYRLCVLALQPSSMPSPPRYCPYHHRRGCDYQDFLTGKFFQYIVDGSDTDEYSDVLPVKLIGINANLMCQYIELVANHLLVSLGNDENYNTTNLFDFLI